MERRVESPEVKQPLKESIDRLQSEQKHLKAIAEALKPLNLTGEALVLIKGDKTLVIPEKAIKPLEKLGRMTLEINREDVHEIGSIGVGRSLNKDIGLVEEFVLPSKENILAITAASFSVLSSEKPNIMDVLEKIIASGGKRGTELLPEHFLTWVFTNRDIKLEDITSNHWEVISHADTYQFTKYYWEKLREAPGAAFFSVHMHSLPVHTGRHFFQDASYNDVMHIAGEKQFVEWFGILGVNQLLASEKFVFSKEKLTAYYSSIEDITLFKESWQALDKRMAPADNFPHSQRAVIKTYAELLEKVG